MPRSATRKTLQLLERLTVSDTREVKVKGYCGLCIARCGSVATVENGRFTRLDPDLSHPTGQALLRQGPRRSGTRLSQGSPDPAIAPHTPEGRCRSRVGTDLLGRSPGLHSERHAPNRDTIRAACRRIQPILTLNNGNCGLGWFCAPVDECVWHSQSCFSAR